MIDCVAGTLQIAFEPWPSWKMKTMIPNAAPSEMRFRIAALIGSTIERNARVRSRIVSSTTKPSTYGKLP